MNAQLLDDVKFLLKKQPELFSDVVSALRGKGTNWKLSLNGRTWKNINVEQLEIDLIEAGLFFAYRRHASGLAVHIYTECFHTIIDGRGKEKDVEPYDEMYNAAYDELFIKNLKESTDEKFRK